MKPVSSNSEILNLMHSTALWESGNTASSPGGLAPSARLGLASLDLTSSQLGPLVQFRTCSTVYDSPSSENLKQILALLPPTLQMKTCVYLLTHPISYGTCRGSRRLQKPSPEGSQETSELGPHQQSPIMTSTAYQMFTVHQGLSQVPHILIFNHHHKPAAEMPFSSPILKGRIRDSESLISHPKLHS